MNMHAEVQVAHETIELRAPFDIFTRRFEAILGRFDPAVEHDLFEDPTEAATRMEGMAGEQGLMIFGAQNHGALFSLLGKPRKAKRYHVGNPLIALQMTRHDIRAGLYAPLTLYVYETSEDGALRTRVEFDRPSSLFGQFGNDAITDIALGLDEKLERAIDTAGAVLAIPDKAATS